MAGQVQQTFINSVRFGHQDVSLEGETAEQYGSLPFFFPKGCLAAIDWESQQDSGEVQGNRIQSVGVTDGYGTSSGSHELLASEADDWEKQITASGQFPLMSVFFNFRLTYAANQGIDVRVVEFIGMKIKNVSGSSQRGNDAATTKYQWRAGLIKVNGVLRYGDPST